MKCEAHIRILDWHRHRGRTGCSFGARRMVQGVPMCDKHAEGRGVPIDADHMIEALRDIAHGSAATPQQTVAVMQTIARRALGEIT